MVNFLETEHPVKAVDIIVERMDLLKPYEGCSYEGNPPLNESSMSAPGSS